MPTTPLSAVQKQVIVDKEGNSSTWLENVNNIVLGTQLLDFLSSLYIKNHSHILTETADDNSDHTFDHAYQPSLDTKLLTNDDLPQYTTPTCNNISSPEVMTTPTAIAIPPSRPWLHSRYNNNKYIVCQIINLARRS